jgi:YVTN family beta-propeller protein
MKTFSSLWLGIAVVGWSFVGNVRGAEMETVRERRPVALATSNDGARLFVANQKSGSISVVDTHNNRVIAEQVVGKGLSDLALLADGRRMLAVDRAGNALLWLEIDGDAVRTVDRLSIADDPVTVAVANDGRSCVVASTWSKRLTFVALPTGSGARLAVTGTLDLPFAPRCVVWVGAKGELIAADAFGGKLAVIDGTAKTLRAVRSLPAHNIRGLATTHHGRTLVVAHQTLKRSMKTDFEDVHWGRLLTSHVRSLRVDAVLTAESDADLDRGGCVIDLGFATDGAGDPAALVCDRTNGNVVAVAVAGVDQVALSNSPSGYFRRSDVGRAPSALALGANSKTVYVADTFDDTISVVDSANGRRLGVITLGPRPALTTVDVGERLFHDARLSHDGWMSCQSCHTDGHANGQLGDTLGDGAYGAPKRVPSLLGVGTTGPWSWNGSVDTLKEQVRKSIHLTMRGNPPPDDQVTALTAYLSTLTPPPGVVVDEKAVARGREVFGSRQCAECHAPPSFTSKGRYDVGLVDESGQRAFNPPSLLGVGRRDSLLHDGRASTLPEVFRDHKHPDGEPFSARELEDLVAYLKSL